MLEDTKLIIGKHLIIVFFIIKLINEKIRLKKKFVSKSHKNHELKFKLLTSKQMVPEAYSLFS